MSDASLFDLASDPNTPPEVLDELAYHEEWQIRFDVAQNPRAPVSALEKLENDEDNCIGAVIFYANVRENNTGAIPYAIALNPNTPAFLLEKLIARNLPILDSYIAANPNTTQRLKNYINARGYVNSIFA